MSVNAALNEESQNMLETPTAVPPLHHFACMHTASYSDGRIVPGVRLMSPIDRMRLRLASKLTQWTSQMAWFTTLSDVDHKALWGCDCTPVCYRVLPGEPVFPWSMVRAGWPQDVVQELESLPGAEPETWWVSGGVVQVELASKGVKVDR